MSIFGSILNSIFHHTPARLRKLLRLRGEPNRRPLWRSSPKMEERCRKVCVIELARSVPAAREVPLEPLVLTSTNAGPQQSK